MTEQDAAMTVCPRTIGSAVGTCMGAKCMAWRWSRAKETKAFLAEVRDYMKNASCDFNHATQKIFARDGARFEQTEGYCGQFGKPE
jgi:hypothetical protein